MLSKVSQVHRTGAGRRKPVNFEPDNAERLPRNLFDSSPLCPPMRVDFGLAPNLDRTGTNNRICTDNAVQRPPRDTHEQDLFFADRAGVICSSFRRGLGVPPCVGHPSAVDCCDAMAYLYRGCSLLSRFSLVAVHSTLVLQSEMLIEPSCAAGAVARRAICE
jgi:hypothetical protein